MYGLTHDHINIRFVGSGSEGGPGPGSYQPKASFTEQQEDESLNPGSKGAFGISAKRNLGGNLGGQKVSDVDADRGPGSYLDLPNISYELGRKVFGRCGSFGVTSHRFPKKKLAVGVKHTPGPGTYTQKKLLQPKRQTGVFASKTKRMKDKKTEVGPGPTHYTPHGYVSESSKYDQIPTGVFKSKNPRFETAYDVKKVQESVNVGPGLYHTTIHDMKPSSLSIPKANRFQAAPVAEGPGPGTYIDPTYQIVKPTFNATIGNDFMR